VLTKGSSIDAVFFFAFTVNFSLLFCSLSNPHPAPHILRQCCAWTTSGPKNVSAPLRLGLYGAIQMLLLLLLSLLLLLTEATSTTAVQYPVPSLTLEIMHDYT